MFDTEFGFNGTVDFHTSSTFSKSDLGISDLPGTYVMDYVWYPKPSGLFDVATLLDQNSDQVVGLIFEWSVNGSPAFQIDMTPQDFLQRLGTPSQMLASVSISESATVGGVHLLVVYDHGVVLHWISSVPMSSMKAKFCLGSSTYAAGGGLGGQITIVEPFTDRLNNLSAFQKIVVANQIQIHGLLPFEDVFGITPEAATQLALKGGDNCLYSK